MARWFLKNTGFELGDRDWSKGVGWSVINSPGNARSGSWAAQFTGSAPESLIYEIDFPIRPGGKLTMSAWFDGSAATGGGTGRIRVRWRDNDGLQVGGSELSVGVVDGQGGYVFEELAGVIAPARTKEVRLDLRIANTPDGSTWFADDVTASGDIIESVPTSADIRSYRIVPADTVGVFDPLIGDDKFTEFDAGMSDKWAGVFTFVPAIGADLGELVTFLKRMGRRERFFAFDPDRTTPLNGVVNGMVVDGGANGGNTRIPVSGGPTDTTALVVGDYVEVGAQYFQVQRDLELGPEGTGDLIVWPSVRASLVDGEDVITDNPKMVARITSDLDWRRIEARPVELTASWLEV